MFVWRRVGRHHKCQYPRPLVADRQRVVIQGQMLPQGLATAYRHCLSPEVVKAHGGTGGSIIPRSEAEGMGCIKADVIE